MSPINVHIVDTQLTNNNNGNNGVAILGLHLAAHSAHTVIVRARHSSHYVLCWERMCHNHGISVNGRKGTSLIGPPNSYIHLLNASHYEFILSFTESQKLI